MARKPRIESSDGLYHIINRGNYRSYIFEEEGARNAFQKTLFEACGRNGWELYAYCILSNHFHLCLGTPRGNLSEGMRWLQATFATRFNRFRKENGHLFQGRFKSLLVEPGEMFLTLVNYIHLNPLRAGLVEKETIAHYPWSSLWFFPKRKARPDFLNPGWLTLAPGMDDNKGGWIRYQNLLRLRAETDLTEIDRLDREMTRGWCIGSKKFKQSIAKEYFKKKQPIRLEKEELKEFNRLQWELFASTALAHLNIKEEDILNNARSVRWKLAIASKMKRELSVSNAWLSKRLHMGVPNAVSGNCGKYRRQFETKCKYARKLRNMKYEH